MQTFCKELFKITFVSFTLCYVFRVIIIDEAHERTLHTEVLFGHVKSITKRRPDVKVLISSATLDVQKLSSVSVSVYLGIFQGRTVPFCLFTYKIL